MPKTFYSVPEHRTFRIDGKSAQSTGPGAFWNVAIFFKLFGVSLASARILLIVDLALIAACLYWLAAEFGSRALGSDQVPRAIESRRLAAERCAATASNRRR
jgi:hypothetical protein